MANDKEHPMWYDDWTENPYIKSIKQEGIDLQDLIEHRIRLQKSRDQLEAEIKRVTGDMAVILATAGIKTIRHEYDGKPFTVSYVERMGASKLDKKLLLMNGVTTAQIEKATIPGKPQEPTVMIRKVGEKDKEGDD